MRPRAPHAAAALAMLFVAAAPASASTAITVGSKAFPESWILGEVLADRARTAGAVVDHRANLGGTEILVQGLAAGAIDAYPEYTGTILEVILKDDPRAPARDARGGIDLAALNAALAPRGLVVSTPLGFNDGYGLAVTRSTATRLGLATISDLATQKGLRYGLSHEFLGRADGWPGLAARYGLDRATTAAERRGLQHELAWEALRTGAIDVTDVYTTDAWIGALDLVVLADDRAFFPRYDAVVLHRADLATRAPEVVAAWQATAGTIDERRMIAANAAVVLEGRPYAEVARSMVAAIESARGAARVAAPRPSPTAPGGLPLGPLGRHLELVSVALALSVLVGVPLGVLAARVPALSGVVLGTTGVLQTIPSLALLAFLVPLLGIGVKPALAALFLYGLLPIVRNTAVGLNTIAPGLVESAHALGLSSRARLFSVFLPLVSPTILAGIRTSAVISVGNATLAALIGAGGLGEPILTGIQLRDPGMILAGALPAAGLALLAEAGFAAAERIVVPRGLRLRPGGTSDDQES